METLKNFFAGLAVIIVSLFIFAFFYLFGWLGWLLAVGAGTILLLIAETVLFIVLIFYIIVLVGMLVRSLFPKAKK